jgi:hypothetical protein
LRRQVSGREEARPAVSKKEEIASLLVLRLHSAQDDGLQ